MFSVVIPLYNKELSVKNTIQSVLNQVFADFEIVVVNDGSTDNSLKVVQQINDSRIRIIDKPNGGVSSARNRGIEEAKYEWIAFLDADDLWENNHLEELKNMIAVFPKNKIFCTSHTKSKLKYEYTPRMKDDYEIIDDYFDIVMKHVDFFWTGAVCIHKTVFEKVGVFPLEINRGEDLYLWANIGRKYRIIRSEKITVNYNFYSENKLTGNKSEYNKSLISKIDLKNTKGIERTYYKKMLFNRLKRNVKSLSIKEIFVLLLKHNIDLIKK